MTALQEEFKTRLEHILFERFVGSLPPTRNESNDKKTLSRALSAFALNKKLDIQPQEAAKSVIDDINDHGIDAIYYHPAPNQDDGGTLFLVQAKLKSSEEFKQEDALAMIEGVRKLLNKNFESFNELVQNRKIEIEQAIDDCSHIQLLVIYTGSGVSQTANQNFDTFFAGKDDLDERIIAKVEYISAQNIEQFLRLEQAPQPVHTDLYLTKSQKIDQESVTYYGLVNITDMIELHTQHGKALFEHNIRYFLGTSKSAVNQSIQKTLREQPQQFFYLNNGITAIAEILEPKSNHNRGRSGVQKIKVRGLSIINGAQTISTCADFAKNNPDIDLSAAKVMFTLIKADARQFGVQITKARNHQNPVMSNNFAALDPVQERIRQDIAVLNQGYEYLYRPEAIINTTKIIRIEEALNAMLLLSNNSIFPSQIKNNPSALNTKESSAYQSVFTENLKATRLLNATLIYQILQNKILGYEQASSGSEKLIIRHGKYTMIAVMMKRLTKHWIDAANVVDEARLRESVSQPLDELRQQLVDLFTKYTYYKGPLAFFRNQSDVVGFLNSLMRIHFDLLDDVALDKMTSNPSDDFPQKSQFDYLIQRAPQIPKEPT